MKKEINPAELDFLLRFPAAPNTTSPVDFISHVGWGAIKTLSAMDEFRNLDRDIENNSKRWRKFVEAEAPEKEKFPQVRILLNNVEKFLVELEMLFPLNPMLSSNF